jgi:hypothetical protein
MPDVGLNLRKRILTLCLNGLKYLKIIKEAHSVSFKNFNLVMFYGNQII